MLALVALHAAVLVMAPTAPVIALGIWWNANTISHTFIHEPFFRRPVANWLFGGCLSLLLGFPQSFWRYRHLCHHGRNARDPHSAGTATASWREGFDIAVQTLLVMSLWTVMAARAPTFFVFVYLPGYAGGLMLCALHGYYEHAFGLTSHYGKLYNLVFFNDGYHAEHHAHPQVNWRYLPAFRGPAVRASRWPAPLRWLEGCGLEALEGAVARSRVLQWFVLRTHTRALAALIRTLPPVYRVAVVGGGLFPRSALVLRRLLPATRITIIDANARNLDRARTWIGEPPAEFVHGRYPSVDLDKYDLVIFPLAFDGNRDALYVRPPAPAVIVHDWLWRRRGVSRIVSIALFKRVNLVVS